MRPGESISVDRSARGEYLYDPAVRAYPNALCGGRADFMWRGADIYGHKIELKEVVNLVCDSNQDD